MDDKTIIRVQNATKRFKEKLVFENISLEIKQGKSYGFIGYNGSGKSVFFKTICGFAKLTSGAVYYEDQEIGKTIDFIQDAGVIIETPEFMNHLSGYKNLKAISEILGLIDDARILEVLEMVGLSDDKDVPVKKYSLGMKQKLRIAQALMESPRLLILDEPTNGLDKESVSTFRNIMVQFVEDGGTLLLASHNKDDIKLCCEEIYEFDNHQLEKVESEAVS